MFYYASVWTCQLMRFVWENDSLPLPQQFLPKICMYRYQNQDIFLLIDLCPKPSFTITHCDLVFTDEVIHF